MASFQQRQRQQQHQQQQQYAPLVGGEPPAVPAFDPEASPIPGQQAWAILDLHGRMVRRSNNTSSSSSTSTSTSTSSLPSIVLDAPTLYNMLVESTPLVADTSTATNGLNRMTVNFGGSSSSLRYVVARDEHHVYLVQTMGV